jgi:hypothetical protein
MNKYKLCQKVYFKVGGYVHKDVVEEIKYQFGKIVYWLRRYGGDFDECHIYDSWWKCLLFSK